MTASSDPLSGHISFSTTDLDQVVETTKKFEGFQRRTLMDSGPLSYQLNYAFLQNTGISWGRCNRDMEIDVQGFESSYKLHFFQSGSSSYTWPDQTVNSANRCAVILSPGRDLKIRHRDFSAFSIMIERKFLEEEFSNRQCAPLKDPLFFNPVLRLDSPVGSSVQRMVMLLIAELEQPESMIRKSPLALEQFEKSLVNVLLSGHEHNYSDNLEKFGDCTNQGRIKKVEDFVDSHLAESLSIDLLARVAGVGARSLQQNFRRYRNTSPIAFVQTRRLLKARQVFLAPLPRTNVTGTALSVGFSSISRFSGLYKNTFGETPSQTLNRGRLKIGSK